MQGMWFFFNAWVIGSSGVGRRTFSYGNSKDIVQPVPELSPGQTILSALAGKGVGMARQFTLDELVQRWPFWSSPWMVKDQGLDSKRSRNISSSGTSSAPVITSAKGCGPWGTLKPIIRTV